MSPRPAYFEPIRQRAADRWEQLENDPELAAPWWQLFKQVQSPRHIVSELLQNADDAGATEAIVRIEEDAFVFEHDGEDLPRSISHLSADLATRTSGRCTQSGFAGLASKAPSAWVSG